MTIPKVKVKRAPKPPTPTEAAVLRDCLALLKSRGVLAYRNNTGAMVGEYKGKRRFVRFGVVGAPDIVGLLPGDGRYIGVEIKRPGKKPSDEQIAFMQRVNKSGGVAFWVDKPEYLDVILGHVLKGARVRVEDDGHVIVEYQEYKPT